MGCDIVGKAIVLVKGVPSRTNCGKKVRVCNMLCLQILVVCE